MIWVIMLALCIHVAPVITTILLALLVTAIINGLYWTFEMRRA